MPKPFYSQIDLFLDVTSYSSFPCRFLAAQDSSKAVRPQFFQGDVLLVRLWLCRPGRINTPAALETTDRNLVLCVRSKRDETSTLLTQTGSFVLVDSSEAQDGSGTHYEAILNLNTTELQGVFSGGATGIEAAMDIALVSTDGTRITKFGSPVQVIRRVYAPGTPDSTPALAQYPSPDQLVTQAYVQEQLWNVGKPYVDSAIANAIANLPPSTGGGGIAAVTHDDSLVGQGTPNSPLMVVPANPPNLSAVYHDATLIGNGTSTSPLSVVPQSSSGGGGGSPTVHHVAGAIWEGDMLKIAIHDAPSSLYIEGKVGGSSEVIDEFGVSSWVSNTLRFQPQHPGEAWMWDTSSSYMPKLTADSGFEHAVAFDAGEVHWHMTGPCNTGNTGSNYSFVFRWRCSQGVSYYFDDAGQVVDLGGGARNRYYYELTFSWGDSPSQLSGDSPLVPAA